MRLAYALIGLAFIGLLFAASYGMDSRKTQNMSDTMSATSTSMETTLSIASVRFGQDERIPLKYTCDSDAPTNPPLKFSGVPEGTKSLALIMDDPDVPKALHPDGVFDHWVLFNIAPETREIKEGDVVGIAGKNGRGQNTYAGPCPPPQYEPKEHRYVFVLYALDSMLPLDASASKADVLKAMEGHTLQKAELIGRYSREQ